jgi:Ser/Thr protein kinase RdoA (MazF antagonist)
MSAQHIDAPADSELVRALYDSLGFELVRLVRRPHAYESSFAVEELELDLIDGKRLQLIFKDIAWERQHPDAIQAKPKFLFDPTREIDTYKHMLSPLALGARYVGSIVDPATHRHWLFLERVCGVELHQIGDIAVWQGAARWLARLHKRFSGQVGRVPASLLQHDSLFYGRWLGRALAFQARRPASPPEGLEALQRVAAGHDGIIQRLHALPLTFLHGEFHSTNILVRQTADGSEVVPVDWESAAVGPGLTDLAALVSGAWRDEDRLAIVGAYHEALPADARPSFSQLLEDLAYCRLQLAVQWLGWSEAWKPPPEKLHDWLGDVVELADQLQL